MDQKTKLVEQIKKWVKIDNEIKQLKKEENTRKKIQKQISSELIETMRENEIDEFNIKNGKLVYTKQNIKKPITKKNLMDILSKYFESTEKANILTEYIDENREVTEKETIKFKPNNDL
jgi:hypothetical protein